MRSNFQRCPTLVSHHWCTNIFDFEEGDIFCQTMKPSRRRVATRTPHLCLMSKGCWWFSVHHYWKFRSFIFKCNVNNPAKCHQTLKSSLFLHSIYVKRINFILKHYFEITLPCSGLQNWVSKYSASTLVSLLEPSTKSRFHEICRFILKNHNILNSQLRMSS